MNIEELALKHANDHPGYLLTDWYDAAMPAFQLTTRANFIGTEPLPPVEQFVLRCLEAQLNHIDEIYRVLGLSETLAANALENLDQLGCISIIPNSSKSEEKVTITNKGRKALAELKLLTPREENFSFCLDAISEEYFPVRTLLTAKVVKENDLYEVPVLVAKPAESLLDIVTLRHRYSKKAVARAPAFASAIHAKS
jgi:DNA-binding MarR family transcriptional regulator